MIESRAVTIAFASTKRLKATETALHALRPPVIGRVADNKLILDMRGAEPLDELSAALASLS